MDKYKDENLDTISPAKWQQLSTSFYPNKDINKVRNLAFLFLEREPDIIMLTEVGGEESLSNFNKYFLENKYHVLIKPSNSDRGIDLGYLVNKSLDLEAQLIAHTEAKLDNQKKFARGVFELRLLKNNKPVFINFLCHLKSKLNLNKKDFEGRSQRVSEVKYLKKLYRKRRVEFPQIPMTISGDLNAIIYKEETEPELLDLLSNTGLKDIFEHLDRPLEQRITYCYFDKKHDRYDMQLDYILLPEKFKSIINPEQTHVLNFDPHTPVNYPKNLPEKLALASDHYPIQCTISLNAHLF